MTATGIRFSRKETRQLASEAEKAGFVYVDDDTKGHARYLYAGRCALHQDTMCEHARCVMSLSETPGHGQIVRIRDTIARVTGTTRRGKYDRTAARARRAAEKQKATAEQQATLGRADQAEQATERTARRIYIDRLARALASGRTSLTVGSAYAKTLDYDDGLYFARSYAKAKVDWCWNGPTASLMRQTPDAH